TCQRTICIDREPTGDLLRAGGSRSQGMATSTLRNQRPAWVDGGLGAVMLDAAPPVGTEEVEPQAVCARFVYTQQPGLHLNPFRGVDLALEDAVLNALAVVEAGFGNAVQAALAGISGG